tara:strand:- start:875 stop:982 length:108 start_codon:yes stop_codon:yes gene_type:complete
MNGFTASFVELNPQSGIKEKVFHFYKKITLIREFL